jgi:biopolymer transport protein TolR
MEIGQNSNRRRTVLAQINVTPFVDVMLVLLIIFMITAPEIENAPNLSSIKEPLVITVNRKGQILVGSNRVENAAKLTPVLQQILSEREDKTVYLEADKAVPYGDVVQVMAAVKKAGVVKLGMVAQEPQK